MRMFVDVDTSGDGAVEKSEFEQARTKNPNLNATLVQIFEKKFQQDSATKLTYEGTFFLLSFTAIFFSVCFQNSSKPSMTITKIAHECETNIHSL